MKKLLLLVLITACSHIKAQESSQETTELYKLSYGESLSIENIRLEFKTLSADSRCPKEVTCVRAGEAIVTLNVYLDNVLQEELQLVFYPYGVSEQLTKFLKAENILIKNLQLLPYPKPDQEFSKTNYFIQFYRIEHATP